MPPESRREPGPAPTSSRSVGWTWQRWLAGNDLRTLAALIAVGCLLQGYAASAQGRWTPALAAALLAVVSVGSAEGNWPHRHPTAFANLIIASFWVAAVAELAAALSSRASVSPALLFLPLAAFAGLPTSAAWAWSLVAACSAALLPLLAAVDPSERAGERSTLLACGLLAAALAASLQRARHPPQDQAAERPGGGQPSRPSAWMRQVANVSHELKTPLNGIIGTLDLALRGDLEGPARVQIERAKSSAELLLGLIDDLQDLDQLEAGQFTLRQRPFAPRDLAEDIERLLAARAQIKGLALVVDVVDDVPDVLYGDPRRLRQILVNLVGNALKFTRHGSVSLRFARAGGTGDRPLIRFTVRDTGRGIPPEQAARLFERRSRGDEHSDRWASSSGLGLAISRELAQAMASRIEVETPSDGGTRFWLDVPLSLPGPGFQDEITTGRLSPPAGAARERRRAPQGVLVVEDDPISREVTLGQLGLLGLPAEARETGEEALERLASGPPIDVVLMDVELPGVGGLETTRRWRAREGAGGPVIVVALTARGLPEEQAECLAAGMDSCLTKPITIEALRRTLAVWFELAPVVDTGGHQRPGPPTASQLTATVPTVLDQSRLADLERLGRRLGRPLLATLTASFSSRSPEVLTQLRTALQSGDRRQLRLAAHTLAGSSANLGAVRVTETAKSIERQAETGDLEPVAAAIEALAHELETARAALRERLPAAGTPGDGEPPS